MINETLYKQYILKLRGNSRIPKYIKPISLKKNICNLSIEDQYKNIYLHELPNRRRFKNCYHSKYSLHDLFFSDYTTIQQIAQETANKKIKTKFLENTFDDKYDQTSSSHLLFSSFESYTCDYCQTQIGYVFKGEKRQHYTGFIDHIYPKSKHPILSMSYGNLVCSCYTCNSILKNDRQITINDIKKICPPELFIFKIKKQAIQKIHQVNYNLMSFI